MRAPELTQPIDSALIISSETKVTCPPIVVELINQDGSPLDSTVFSYDNSISDDLMIYTTDSSKEGTFDLQVRAYHEGYPSVFTFDWSIQIEDTCKNALLTFNFPIFLSYYKMRAPQIV